MIKSVTVTNHLGESLKMELTRPEVSAGFYIQRIEGLGPVKATVNIIERSIADGAYYGSARAGSRNIVMYLGFLDNGVNGDIETIRHRSYKYFPLKKRVTIQIETDKRVCETYGYVESNEPDIFSNGQTTQISIVCPDSYFYDADSNRVSVESFSSTKPMFTFPFSNKANSLVLGDIQINEEKVILYDGDAEVGITMRIKVTGNISGDIALYDITTDESMVISNEVIPYLVDDDRGIHEGDEIVIKTSRGEKSITLLRGYASYNIINSLSMQHGYPGWFQLVPGNNIFAYQVDDGAENLQFTVEYKTAYEGV
jgi:hypothetical protein